MHWSVSSRASRCGVRLIFMEVLAQILTPRFLAQARPVVVAVLIIALFYVLLWPRRKPPQPPQRPGAVSAGSSSSSTGTARTRGLATSISTRGVLLEFENGKPRVLPGAVDALLRLAKTADLYLVTTLPRDDDAVEAATLEVMTAAGLFAEGGCARCKALFCATEDGRSAIARQLSPAVHVDTSPKVLTYLAPHLSRVVYVHAEGAPLEGVTKGTVVSARSLGEYAEKVARLMQPQGGA